MAATKTKKAAFERPEIEERIVHLAGCPELERPASDADSAPRTESFSTRRPTGEVVTVARCVECGVAIAESEGAN